MTARLPVGPDAVARAIRFSRRFAEAAGLDAATIDRLVIIVEEWAANIVEHGAAAPGSLIVLELRRTREGVRIAFSDAGLAFDPRTAEEQGPNLQRGGGAGIALIRFWSRISDYRRRRSRNRVVIELDFR
jgi:serine/threonine-protein kinase RsbW